MSWRHSPDPADVVSPNLGGVDRPGPVRGIRAVYPPKKIVSPKVRAFIAFFEKEKRFGRPPYWEKEL
jgi:DNA-binding transcriptional LysR family regulator